MTRDLSRLLSPRSIAVVGGGWGRNVIAQLQKAGYGGAIWPVHPVAGEVRGLPAYPNLSALPAAPDAAFLAINRHATVEAVAQLSAMGAGGAICFASGFAEAAQETQDGPALQAELLQEAGEMPVLGPNCYGVLNYLDNVPLWPDQHGGAQVTRGVAILAQSSNIALNLTMQQRGLPTAMVLTLGNQAQTGMAAAARALLKDPRITAIGLYVEGFGDLRDWEALATEARAAGRSIVALKSGKSVEAQAASLSHTASLAGSHAGAAAFMARLGILEAQNLEHLLETLKVLHCHGRLPHGRIASMSCSGGEAGLMADLRPQGLTYPPLNSAQETDLRAALGPQVALANPLDYHTYIWGDVPAMTATFTAMMQGDLAVGLVVLDFPRQDRCSLEAWEPVITSIAAAQQASGKPIGVLASLPESLPEDIALRLMDQGILPLCGMAAGLEALRLAAQPLPNTPQTLCLPQSPTGPAPMIDEATAKSLLRDHGMDVPQGRQCASAEAAGAYAETLTGPLVLKGIGLAHKSEAGAVRLGLTGPKVAEAAKAMPTQRYLVEEMISDTTVELLIGVIRDPAHGFVLTLGAGGTQAELMQDKNSLLVPSEAAEIETALRRLRLWPVIEGYRAKPGANLSAIIAAITALQDFVQLHAETLEELEVNPLICTPQRAVVADALLRMRSQPDQA